MLDLYPGEDKAKKWVKGGCHCGKVRYEANIVTNSEDKVKMIRCNCTFCQKLGSGNLPLENNEPDNFKLIAPTSKSEISSYQFANLPRYFCDKCSVFCFADGFYDIPNGPRVYHIYINPASIDQPQEGVDVSKIEPVYLEGITINNPDRQPNMKFSSSPYPGGLL